MSTTFINYVAPSGGGGGYPAGAFVTTWRTTGASESITVPTISSGSYNCTVDWGDGSDDVITTWNDAAWTHVYATAADYEVTITGTFNRIYFNDGGDKLKLIAINQWGTVGWGTDLGYAFYGCSNLAGSLPSDMLLGSLTNGVRMFQGCSSLTSLPSDMVLGSMTNGTGMFQDCSSLTSLPSSLTLASITNGTAMFQSCSSLTSLPSGMTMPSLNRGDYMFYNTSLSGSLPSGMVLGSMTNGTGMFHNCSSLTSLPSGMVLGSMTNGTTMFRSCSSLTSLPSSLTLASMTNGTSMFQNCSSLSGAFPSGMTLPALTNGINMFNGANAITTAFWSDLLIAIEAANANTGVSLHGGNATYSAGAAATARANLLARSPAWVITDGGPA